MADTDIVDLSLHELRVSGTSLDHGWRWLQADGTLIAPADMKTRHCFYTLRLIWNNHYPKHCYVGTGTPVRRFNDRTHPKHYLAQAVVHLMAELSTRHLPPDLQQQLDEMRAHLQRRLHAQAYGQYSASEARLLEG